MSRRPSDDLMDPFSDDDIGAIEDAAGDELDLAEAIGRANPSSDQLQHFADMRGVKHALLDKQAPFARINPPSVLKGSLGNQVGVVFGERKQVANWVGEDAETLPVTVTFGAVQKPTANALTVFRSVRPFGIVQFGTRSSLLTAEVDIGFGCQFTIGASMVTLQVAMDGGPIIAPAAEPIPELLSGMLSFHPIVRAQPTTRTLYTDFPFPLVLRQSIPQFAKSLVVVKTSLALPATTVLFLDSAVNSCGFFSIPVGTQQTIPFQIPGDAIEVLITDGAAGGIANRAIFQLAL